LIARRARQRIAFIGMWLFALTALLLPPAWVIERLIGPQPSDPVPLLVGVLLFKVCLAIDGLLAFYYWRRLRRGATAADGRGTVLGLPTDDGMPGRHFKEHFLLVTVLIFGLILRSLRLNTDLWLDELASLVSYVQHPLGRILSTYLSANQHLLYSILAHISIKTFGETATALRLPAVLFGVAGLWALDYFAQRVASRKEALLATLLFAVSYHHIFFSQNARGYSAFLFFSLLGTGLFLRALATNHTHHWAAYVAVMVLNLANHPNALLIFLSHIATYGLLLVFKHGKSKPAPALTRRVLWVAALIGFFTVHAYALIIPEMFTYYATADRTGVGWSLASADFLKELARGVQLGFGTWLAAALLLLVCTCGLASYLRNDFWVVIMLALPGVFGVASVWLMRVGTYPRFFLFALPIALLMFVRGARVIGRAVATWWLISKPARVERAIVTTLLAGAVLASGLSLIPYYRTPKQDYTGALAFVKATRRPADSIVAVDLAAVGCRYYSPDIRAANTVSELERIRAEGQPVWLLYTFPRSLRARFPQLATYIEEHYTIVRTFAGTVGDGEIFVCHNKE
jgi:hypothetical protein